MHGGRAAHNELKSCGAVRNADVGDFRLNVYSLRAGQKVPPAWPRHAARAPSHPSPRRLVCGPLGRPPCVAPGPLPPRHTPSKVIEKMF